MSQCKAIENNLSTAIYEMKLSLTSVYTQQKSHQTSKSVRNNFRNQSKNQTNLKYKHFDNFSHTMSHKATNLSISMGC